MGARTGFGRNVRSPESFTLGDRANGRANPVRPGEPVLDPLVVLDEGEGEHAQEADSEIRLAPGERGWGRSAVTVGGVHNRLHKFGSCSAHGGGTPSVPG